ncbi:zinc finger matrin-type protein 5 isoform X3 [Amblyraja radiata]|uniref:zinc finger matrin-type protein 5 isoform X3 n=1 Tax=Amblyraja radiata TaxID=386614 RepID=UPI001403252E|nr:zinc finger matrin-type protein 5 isoform X3 [Amblyraja radiata]
MGKTYFCDYCGRSFQDNLHNRKKHLQGVQHQRAKKFWFDSFRDNATILVEELAKKPCRKFLQSGQCDFGANCKFSHMTDEDIQKLRQKVEEPTGLISSTLEYYIENPSMKKIQLSKMTDQTLTLMNGWQREPKEKKIICTPVTWK